MRLYTAVIGSQRVLTLNASDVQEAREALSTLLGDVAALSIRHASADEALAWNASAMEVGKDVDQIDTLGGHRTRTEASRRADVSV
jgi:hypothetical protein